MLFLSKTKLTTVFCFQNGLFLLFQFRGKSRFKKFYNINSRSIYGPIISYGKKCAYGIDS